MLKKLIVLSLSLFLLAACSDSPVDWENMNMDERAKAFISLNKKNISLSEKRDMIQKYWSRKTVGDSKELYEKLDGKDKEDWKKIVGNSFW